MSHSSSKPAPRLERRTLTVSEYLSRRGLTSGVTLEHGALDHAAALLADDVNRRYDVGDVLARGGMGAIHSARDTNVRRTVALKLMLDPKDTDPVRVLRFIEEAQITGQLEHPGIVPVYELGVDADEQPFYTMKLVRGTTLSDILKRIRDGDQEAIDAYPLGRLLTIFVKICDAVAFAHSRGVVHRDLKPSNIMVGSYGEVLVMDWGLAKILERGSSQGVTRHSQESSDGDGGAKVLRTVEGGGLKVEEKNVGGGSTPRPARDSVGRGSIPRPSDRLESPHGSASHTQTQTAAIQDAPGVVHPSGPLPPSTFHLPPTFHPPSSPDFVEARPPPAAPAAISSIRHDTDTPELTLDGQVMGTPGFMAPEQAQGELGGIDERTDIFALGAILHTILTLHPPTDDGTPAELLQDVMVGRPASASADSAHLPHCPHGRIPSALASVTLRAMAPSPEDRYQSVEGLKDDIDAYLGGFATSVEQAGLLRQLMLLIKRHKTEFSLAAAALAVIAILVATFIVRLSLEEKQTAAALDDLRQLSRDAAPEFLAKAQAELDKSNWDAALRAAGMAVGLRPDLAEAWLLKGRLHLAALQLAEAVKSFRQCSGLDTQGLGALAARYEDLAGQSGGSLPDDRRLELAMELHAKDDLTVAARLLDGMEPSKAQVEIKVQAALRALKRLNPGIEKLKYSHEITPQFQVDLDLRGNRELSDIMPLRGLPLRLLYLHGSQVGDIGALEGMRPQALYLPDTQVADISALDGMPLQALVIQNTPVSDISVLKGMPLRKLDIIGTKVSDITPLRGMRLTRLNIDSTNVSDIDVLAGMPLTYLSMGHTHIEDITVLKGMPLTTLNLTSTQVSDISVLQGMPITELYLSSTRIRNISPLQGMPLTKLVLSTTDIRDISVLKGMPLTSVELARTKVSDISALKRMPLTYLNLSTTEISDIGALNGMRLTRLYLTGTNVTDLAPLRGMPLIDLRMRGLEVDDIDVLRGMQLEVLHLGSTRLRDISVLNGMPLKELALNGCTSLTDLSPLADCKQLERLTIPTHCKDIEFLRDLPNLKQLDTTTIYLLQQSAAEFWRKWDAAKANHEAK